MFLFLPVGDHPNPPRAQWVTRVLLGINIVVHLFIAMPLSQEAVTVEDLQDPAKQEALREIATLDRVDLDLLNRSEFTRYVGQISRYRLFVQTYGYKPGKPWLLALLFCMFLHGDFWHLAGNMLYLYIYGDNVEARLGWLWYLVAYLGTGIVATLTFASLNTGSIVPLVGASGAISGVLGFYLIWYPHNYIKVFVWLLYFIQIVFIRAYWVLIMYLVVDNIIMPYMRPGGGVAHAAHIGGFVAGMGVAWLVNRVRGAPAAPVIGPAGPRPPGWDRVRTPAAAAVADHTAEFRDAVEHSRMQDAAHAFARLVREGGATPEPAHVFRLAYWLYEQGFVPDSAAVFRFYIKQFPRGADLDRVHLGLGILLSRRLSQRAAAREHLLAALDITEPGSTIAETAKAELARLGG